MRIAVLGWRYVDHPQAGGAETMLHEILRRLVADGHEVTCFTAAYPGSAATGAIDGVRLLRRGAQWSVHAAAWRWLRTRVGEFDRVVDHINTIPFFTPLYVPAARRRFLIHQLARGYWFRQARGPFRLVAPFGYVAEPGLVALYRGTCGMTVSESSRRDLARFGVPPARVSVIPLGLPFAVPGELPPKPADGLRVAILGRLEPAKHVDEAVRAFAEVARVRPDAELDVIGTGDERYRARVERLAGRLGVAPRFHGRVSEERKLDLLRAAHVHLFASHREGWGLTVSEAAAMGTPSAGYDVSGVRDSIAEPGLLARRGDTRALAQIALRLAGDPELYEAVRREAWERARAMSYERSAAAFAAAVVG